MMTKYATMSRADGVRPAGMDDYALGAAEREERYRAAFRSEEFRRWVRSLSPMQRARARERGLLAPHVDGCSRSLSLEELSPARLPVCQPLLPEEEEADTQADSSRARSGELSPCEQAVLRDFLLEEGCPALRGACLRYLCGYGSCAEHAAALGISKQLFHYHVRKVQRRLGLPPMACQKSARARQEFRVGNVRKFLSFSPEAS